MLFILKAGPLADGNAFKLANLNRHIIDSLFKNEPLADRQAINTNIINNTLNNAIANKNLNRAMVSASFSRNSWASDAAEGQKTYSLNMLRYYAAVKDTVTYLRQAVYFYEQYYMRISVDSVKRKDSLDHEIAKNKARAEALARNHDTLVHGSFSFSYPKNSFASELNNAAWNFYQMAGDNNDYLLKAMLWSKRSLELNPVSAYYDTYAHLLYRLKLYDEAESMQRKAVELAKTEKVDTASYQAEYEKMKKKNL